MNKPVKLKQPSGIPVTTKPRSQAEKFGLLREAFTPDPQPTPEQLLTLILEQIIEMKSLLREIKELAKY